MDKKISQLPSFYFKIDDDRDYAPEEVLEMCKSARNDVLNELLKKIIKLDQIDKKTLTALITESLI